METIENQFSSQQIQIFFQQDDPCLFFLKDIDTNITNNHNLQNKFKAKKSNQECNSKQQQSNKKKKSADPMQKSKQNLIFSKIDTKISNLGENKNSSCQKYKHKTSTKNISKANMNGKVSELNHSSASKIKRSQSQSGKYFNKSLGSTLKQQKFTIQTNSESKNSLLSTKKVRNNQKKSFQSTIDKPLKSLSNLEMIEYQNGFLTKKMNKENELRSKSGEKILKNSAIKKDKSQLQIEELKKTKQQNDSQDYFIKIIQEISFQKENKMKEKTLLERQVAELKEELAYQKRLLKQNLVKNINLRNEIQIIESFCKLAIRQRKSVGGYINQTKKKIKNLKQLIVKDQDFLKKLSEQDIEEQQELIQMYKEVINEVQKEIKQQNKKRVSKKAELDAIFKKYQSKKCKFSSMFEKNSKIKLNQAVFKE